MITLIIPCYNEENNITNIKKNILLFKNNDHLIVDGGSCDASVKLYKKFKFNFIKTTKSRGFQQKKGAEYATSKWLFFVILVVWTETRALAIQFGVGATVGLSPLGSFNDNGDINKGLAIKHLDNSYKAYFPMYFGDDLTDNFAFQITTFHQSNY